MVVSLAAIVRMPLYTLSRITRDLVIGSDVSALIGLISHRHCSLPRRPCTIVTIVTHLHVHADCPGSDKLTATPGGPQTSQARCLQGSPTPVNSVAGTTLLARCGTLPAPCSCPGADHSLPYVTAAELDYKGRSSRPRRNLDIRARSP